MSIWYTWLQTRADKLALSTPERDYSWQELDAKLAELGHLLVRQNIGSGDVVALVGKNDSQLVLWYLACLRLGVLCALLPPQPQSALEQKLQQINAKRVWFGAGCQQEYGFAAINSTARLHQVLDGHHLQIEEGTAHLSSHFQRFYLQDYASIVFTSGSTGEPKAVVHTQAQHVASAAGLLSEFEFNQQDSWLLSLPLYHVSGLAIVWRWLYRGARLVVGGGDLSADLSKVTHASLVATQLQRVLANKQPLALKRVLLGGSHIALSLTQAAQQAGIETWLGYGMTETASTMTAKRTDGSETAGHVLPQRQLKVEQGRIYVAGETLAAGYLTPNGLQPLVSDEQPWFDSKDLGVWHSQHQGEAELQVIGRADNQFISGGENIHCEEIERYLNQHPQVEQALVIPVDDEQYGQRPIAFLVARKLLNKVDYQAFLTQYLPKFKCPDDYYLLPVPESVQQSGIKISRVAVKQYYQQSLAKNK